MQAIVGLGNPGAEYQGSRHNVGKDFVEHLVPSLPKKVKVLALDVYMNNSGAPIRKAVPSQKAAKDLIVVHDELDLPLGQVKVSFGSGSGGHKGVDSIIKALKTKDFVRVRVGVSPATPSGKVKRPDGEKLGDFVLGKFKPQELTKLKSARKTVGEALTLLLTGGVAAAMNEINSR